VKNPQNSSEIRVPADESLDGIGKWLMKIAQNLSRQYDIPVEDAFQDAVLQYLKRRHYYAANRGARTTFATMTAGRSLHTQYTRKRARYTVQEAFDVAYTESRECRELPEAAYEVEQLPRRDRRKALIRVLRDHGWTEKEIEELRISSVQKVTLCYRFSLCQHGCKLR